jgi:hypothetical protein
MDKKITLTQKELNNIKYESRKEVYIKIHRKLDNLNVNLGSKDSLCIFCGANEYNGAEGIVHDEKCIIKFLRNKIKSKSF